MNNKIVTSIFFILFALVIYIGAKGSVLRPEAQSVVDHFDTQRMRADIEFLADDLLEGRGTGARGGDVAAAYIASQFSAVGLKPIGDERTYLQKVPLIGLDTQPTSTLKFIPASGEAIELSYLNDFVANALSLKNEENIDGNVLFVGYGIVAPEFQWNDYKGVDPKGKVLLALVNDPSDDPNAFGGKAMTYYGRWTYKYEEAARQKAAGILLIHNTEMASYGWNVVRNSNSSEQAYLENPPGTYNLPMAGWITEESAKKILQAAGHDLKDLMQKAKTPGFAPIELPMKTQAHLNAKVRTFASSNVVGLLEGSDPKKRDEIILYTAHYDHLGIGVPVKGDNIYNGAQDNASGTALVMELARAFAAAKTKPARSVVFLSVTAEERGLRGSEYYGKNPIIPADKTMIDLNYDGLELWGETSDVNVTGAERTSVWPIVKEVAQALHYTIVPEAHPEAGYYYRSDHFSLARVGIPAFSLDMGSTYVGKPPDFGKQKYQEYLEQHYHQPSDEVRKNWDLAGAKKLAALGIHVGWRVAELPGDTGWQPGDEFEKARKK